MELFEPMLATLVPEAFDGEIVAFDAHGVSRFQLLQRRALGESVRPTFAAFDCPARGGTRLLDRPLRDRRRASGEPMPR